MTSPPAALPCLPPPLPGPSFLRFFEDLKDMLGFTPYRFYYYMWKYITPILMMVLLGSSMVQLIMTPPSYSAWIEGEVSPTMSSWDGGGAFSESEAGTSKKLLNDKHVGTISRKFVRLFDQIKGNVSKLLEGDKGHVGQSFPPDGRLSSEVRGARLSPVTWTERYVP